MKVVKENRCILCGGNNVDFQYELNYGKVFQCKNCSAAYTNFNNLENFYTANNAWNAYDRLKSQIYNLPELRKEAAKKLSLLLEFARGKKLIEFGPNTGEFLYVANKKGFNVTAVDKCPAILNLNRFENLKFIETGACNFMSNDKYDAVAAFHLLEHLETPAIFLNKIYKCLNPDGVLFLEVPNYDSLSRKKQGKNWFMFYDYHIVHYNRTSIGYLLNNCGFKVIYSKTLQSVSLLIDPFYLPVRHCFWNILKQTVGLLKGNKNKIAKDKVSKSTNLLPKEEIKIFQSLKARIFRLEQFVKKLLSLPLCPFAYLISKFNEGDVIQIIAVRKDEK